MKNLISLQCETAPDFETNLNTLESLILQTPEDSIILAPEVCITGFCYDRMEAAAEFADIIKEKLRILSADRHVALTLIEKNSDSFLNTFYCYSNGNLIHKQSKHKLFPLGDEHEHFSAGSRDEITSFEIDGISCACLICFEIRFSDLWQQILGNQLIFVPAQWGKPRKAHFETLTRALAIANQAFVIASDGANADMAKGSGVISPFGEEMRDDSSDLLTKEVDFDEVKKMRRYINTGIS